VATHKSALKRHRQSVKRREHNRAMKSTMKTSVKSLLKTIETKDAEAIQKTLNSTKSVLAKAASKGLVPKKTASRKIARLSKRAHAAASQPKA